MSEYVGPPAEPEEVPVSFGAFAETLQPPKARDASGQVIGITGAGAPDEVWLKLLSRNHRNEKRSMESWQALIETYRTQPAHPAGIV